MPTSSCVNMETITSESLIYNMNMGEYSLGNTGDPQGTVAGQGLPMTVLSASPGTMMTAYPTHHMGHSAYLNALPATQEYDVHHAISTGHYPQAIQMAQPGKPKRKRVITFDQRKAANIRERKRMLSLNDSFDLLRQTVPTFSYEKKLSRIETLRLAITYISFMGDILNGKDPKDIHLMPIKSPGSVQPKSSRSKDRNSGRSRYAQKANSLGQ